MKAIKPKYNSVTANQNRDGSINVVAWYQSNRRLSFDMIPVYSHPERHRLEQAAPQMLSALQAALEAIGNTYDARDSDDEGESIRDIITAAIAKATGEEVQG
jgi:hypothetical protein